MFKLPFSYSYSKAETAGAQRVSLFALAFFVSAANRMRRMRFSGSIAENIR
jgi:hypothetical protein